MDAQNKLRIIASPSLNPERMTRMKSFFFPLVLTVLSAVAVAAPPLPAGHPPVNTNAPEGVETGLTQKGKVINSIDVPQYTYLEVSQQAKILWLAAATVSAKTGDVIRFDDGMVMTNFYSRSLKRNFPSIIFVNRLVVTGERE